jgi:indole-3-glycerol phosphate synthase/phosphoribosylanthranilate isomerase
MDILNEIAAFTRKRIEDRKALIPPERLMTQALALTAHSSEHEGRVSCARGTFPFERALAAPGLSFICEVKQASPSKGIISEDFPYAEIACEYEDAGAAAISVLTEPKYFRGSDSHLFEIASERSIPVLRKDFTVDAYQIYEAKILGAAAVLLICAILSPSQLEEYLNVAHKLGLSALVEAHTEDEAKMALHAGARGIGVNNRKLSDFSVDIRNTERISGIIPDTVLLVAESGIKTPEDVKLLRGCGADAVLVGETLMRAADKSAALKELRGGLAKIKLCGVCRDEDIAAVNDAMPDYVGFVFAESRRRISPETAQRLRGKLHEGITPAGVFVNAEIALIEALTGLGVIEIVQLHGDESEEYINEVKRRTGAPVIKAVKVTERTDLHAEAHSAADYLLFDGGAGEGKGFDWSRLRGKMLAKPFFIAGGIDEKNVAAAYAETGAFAVDISSGAETDGVKDKAKIARLVSILRDADKARAAVIAD